MRVTETTMANTTLNNLQRIQQNLQDLQQQVSTGSKISSPGDDPLTAEQILDLKNQYGDGEQYTKNISTGNAFLSTEESALASMGDSLVRLKEIAMEMSNTTYSSTDRANAAKEVDQIRQQLISLGNTQYDGRYVFNGFKDNTPPFDPDTGNYVGDSGSVSINIDSSNTVKLNYPGGGLTGGTNVVAVISNLQTALTNNDVAGIQNTLTALDDSANQVLNARTDIGARMNRLSSSQGLIDNTQVYLQKVISDKQDIDITKAISDLTRQQTAYQAALMSTAKINQMSLLDYLT